MTEEQLLKLKKSLPRGSYKKIAHTLKVSELYVCFVLTGRKKNLNVIEMAIEIAEQEKMRKQSIINKINNL